LGVLFDSRLTFKFHLDKLQRKARLRLSQLARVANYFYGLTQMDLRTMYILYIRSVLEYAAPVWYPCMAQTNVQKLQRLQNQGLRIALGVPRCTQIDALHTEANLPPLTVRYNIATVWQAEKYRRHNPTDPLYQIAHQTLPPRRLQRNSWQYLSDTLLLQAGFYPARQDDHSPAPPNTTSLALRTPISFVPAIPPWNLSAYDRITISPTVPSVTRSIPTLDQIAGTNRMLDTLDHSFASSFWTDASLLQTNYASSVCISFDCDNHPAKRRRQSHDITILTRPTGLVGSSTLAEKQALDLVPYIIQKDPSHYFGQHVFVGTDSQSSLNALDAGPLRDYSHSCTGNDWSATLEPYAMTADLYDLHYHFQYIPAHIGIEYNEMADHEAKNSVQLFTLEQQRNIPIALPTIRTIVQRHSLDRWLYHDSKRSGSRYDVIGPSWSNLRHRDNAPRALQTLYSRWRVGEVESAGVYPRRLKWILEPHCRFCRHPCETTVHLLSDCPATLAYRVEHGISLDTLRHECPENIYAISRFDAWIRSIFPCSTRFQTSAQLDDAIETVTRKRKGLPIRKNTSVHSQTNNCKKRRLVIPHKGLPNKYQTKKRQHVSANNHKQPAVKRRAV
jgi:hypothetical protein